MRRVRCSKPTSTSSTPLQKPTEPLPGATAFAEQPQKPAPPQPEPIRLGGAPPPIQKQPQYGTLAMTSKVAREVTIVGIKLQAPLDAYLLGPGDFIADVKDPDGKTRNVEVQDHARQDHARRSRQEIVSGRAAPARRARCVRWASRRWLRDACARSP